MKINLFFLVTRFKLGSAEGHKKSEARSDLAYNLMLTTKYNENSKYSIGRSLNLMCAYRERFSN